MASIPDSHRDILEAPQSFAHVATIGPDGAPQNNPVWFDWDGQHIRFSQTTKRQKYRNVKREPRVAISVLDPSNAYRYIEVRGKVVRLDPDPDFAFIDKMAKKYIGQDKYPWHQPGDERVVVVVEPERTTQMG
jgi:PPOX class probable F420-dependent enzyme